MNLTVSALSQIERGASDPSISSLRRIGQAFDVPMFQFLIGTVQREIVVRRDRRTKLTFPDRALEYELVSADTSGEFEVAVPDARAGRLDRRSAQQPRQRGMRGRPARRRHRRGGRTGVRASRAGDSIKIHRELLHRFMNRSDAEAEILIIISPPTF